MRVGHVMTHDVETIGPDGTIREAAEKMRSLDVGLLPVVDGKRVIGMITDRDITVRITADGRDPDTSRVREAMSEGMIGCHEDDDVAEAARLMEEHQIRRLPVLGRDKELVGILSLGDIAITTGDEQLTGETLERISEPAKPEIHTMATGRSATETDPVVARQSATETQTVATGRSATDTRTTATGRTRADDRKRHDSDRSGRRMVAGLFADRTRAEQAIEDLRREGIDPGRVSVITKDPSYAREVAGDTGAKVAGSTATGAGLGALLGGAAGWLVGIGALAIPGIGPVLAAGPIAAALGVGGATAAVGAGVGAAAGGIVGALTGWGFSESEARDYESRVAHGDILVTVEGDGEVAHIAEDVFHRDGADRVAGKRAA
jgi:CBS domain-containing protein